MPPRGILPSRKRMPFHGIPLFNNSPHCQYAPAITLGTINQTIQIYSYLVKSDHGTINCRTTGQETVTYLDSGEIGAAAAQARGMPTGKPDRRDCSASANANDCERNAALERKERTRVPLSQGASEAAVQRTEVGPIHRMTNQTHSSGGPGLQRSDRTNSRWI